MNCAASGKNLPIVLCLMLYPVALKIEAREVKDLLRLAMLLAEHPCSQSPQFNIILFLQTKGLRVMRLPFLSRRTALKKFHFLLASPNRFPVITDRSCRVI